MRKRIIRRPKTPEFTLSWEILELFKKKGGVYAVAMRKNKQGTNLYSQIWRCSNAFGRIRRLLELVDHDIKYKIVERKTGDFKK